MKKNVFELGLGLGMHNFVRVRVRVSVSNCLTGTGLLYLKERRLEKQGERARSWASKQAGKLGP